MLSPSKRQRLTDTQYSDQQQCSASEFLQRTVSFLTSRLVDSQGPQAASLQLRPSLQKVHDDLLAVLNNAVFLKQNASLLIVGEPGIGKSLVIERLLRSSISQHNKDLSNPTIGVVWLSGILHSEERTAFQEIAHQLCTTFKIQYSHSATFDDNLVFFKQVLSELQRALKTVVFVIDHLDAFMKAAKQTLLYNVLDALQHSQVQAVVLGVSCYFDVQDMMEKRVRSRFSNRKIFLNGLAAHKDSSDSAAAVLSSMLLLPDDFQPVNRMQAHNSCVHRALDNPLVKAAFQGVSAVGVTPRELSSIALSCLSNWELSAVGQQVSSLQPQHLEAALKGHLAKHDSRISSVTGLSVLELCLLVAALRLEDKGTHVFNFEMLLEQFMSVRQMQHAHMWNKQTAWQAFKDLLDQGLIAFTASRPGSKGMMQRYLPAQLRVAKCEVQQGVQSHSSCPDFVMRWLRGEAVSSAIMLG